jgi:uncharacterized protein (TIGR00369 family)
VINDNLEDTVNDPMTQLKAINLTSAFNRWTGFEIIDASAGRVEIGMLWRAEVAQYSGYLHAGLIGALIDTACGYAAATLVGRVMASHFSVNCLRPAVGEYFRARARVVKPGQRQVFTSCELFAITGEKETLVATGEALLIPVAVSAAA